jgi:hypothetical protein
MNIEEIFELWKDDSEIDLTDLTNSSLKTAKLHHKYYRILIEERLKLRKYELDMKSLKLEKHEFFTQGPSEETKNKGWKLPPIGKILKTDIPTYTDAEKDVQTLSLKIGVQLEKIDLLESIIKMIINRGFQIKNAIEWEKFKQGIV